jgi:hypothetical protein
MSADLTGTWQADNLCISGATLPGNEEPEISTFSIEQEGIYFLVTNITPSPGEKCGGIIIGKEISMTCPPSINEVTGEPEGTGTLFFGELKGPNVIEGINHVPDDGKTCSAIAVRL